MVRLKRRSRSKKQILERRFQFHNGSIKALETALNANATLRFQFHNGSIKARKRQIDRCYLLFHFNSTMVRLKHWLLTLFTFTTFEFQFHNGSIKAGKRQHCHGRRGRFQFHNGSIKADWQPAYLATAAVFQFHNGSIKAASTANNCYTPIPISIPQWFD